MIIGKHKIKKANTDKYIELRLFVFYILDIARQAMQMGVKKEVGDDEMADNVMS